MATENDLAELQNVCEDAQEMQEGGSTYIFLRGLSLPAKCTPNRVDALLRLASRVTNDYPTRLFLSEMITVNQTPPRALNWNTRNAVIFQRTWQAFSWTGVISSGRLIEVLAQHLSAFK